MNAQIVNEYTRLTQFLSRTLGPDYEFTLSGVCNNAIQLVAICNGHISGRDLSSPPTNNEFKILYERLYEREDFLLNYRTFAKDDKVLRTSTFFIKSDAGELLGLYSISFDDSRFSQLSKRIFELCHPDDYVVENVSISVVPLESDMPAKKESDSTDESIITTTDAVLSMVLENTAVPVDRLTQKEKLRIIRYLEERNIFLLKGAVAYVAEQLRCSQATIYRYLSKVSRQHKGEDEHST